MAVSATERPLCLLRQAAPPRLGDDPHSIWSAADGKDPTMDQGTRLEHGTLACVNRYRGDSSFNRPPQPFVRGASSEIPTFQEIKTRPSSDFVPITQNPFKVCSISCRKAGWRYDRSGGCTDPQDRPLPRVVHIFKSSATPNSELPAGSRPHPG